MSASTPNSPLNPDRLELWFRERSEALARFYRLEPLAELEAEEAFEAEPPADDAESEGWKKLCSLADAEAAATDLGVRDEEPLVAFSDVLLGSDWAEIEQLFQSELRRTPFA